MYVSDDVDNYGSRLDELVRRSLNIQESVKSDIAEIRQEMCTKEKNMRQTMEGIVSNEVKKATKCVEEKLDAFLVKLKEIENWKRLRETTTAFLIPAVLRWMTYKTLT